MSLGFSRTLSRWSPAVVLAASLALLTSPAAAAVLHQGAWPQQEPAVSLKVDGLPRSAAIRQLADAAGWSVVTQAVSDAPVTLDVHDQPPAAVLDQLLSDGDYSAVRDGTLVSVSPTPAVMPAAVPAAPAASPPPPAATPATAAAVVDPEDRTVTGGDLRIQPDQVVGDVTVMGGNVDLLGTAKGDVTVVGGSVRIHKGAHVTGDATAVGGALIVDEGATVDGDVSVTGGSLDRAGEPHVRVKIDDIPQLGNMLETGLHHDAKVGTLSRLADDAGHAVERSVLLFVLGVILIALGNGRMEMLEGEIAARPMRSLALGVVGFLASIAAFVLLCATILGIPVAVAGLIAGILLAGVGICAVLTTAGGALIGHRTSNPYLHLAAGTFLFLLLGAIPYFGGMVTATVAFIGIGSLVATRLAGLLPRRNRNGAGQGPYRTAAAG